MICRICLVGLTVLVLNPGIWAEETNLTEVDRFELGQRLRVFEAVLEKQTDAELRRKAIQPLKPVTGLFFTGQLAEIARLLDSARLTLLTGKEPEARQLCFQTLSIRPAKLLIDARSEDLGFTVRSCYPVRCDKAIAMKVRVQLQSAAGKVAAGPIVLNLPESAREGKLPLSRMVPGDYTFRAEVLNGSDQLEMAWEQTVSLVQDLNNRLSLVKKALDKADTLHSIDGASLNRLVSILETLAQNKRQETSYPASRFLDEVEAGVASIASGKPFYGQKRVGQFWLQVPVDRKLVSLRLQAPQQAVSGEPLPLLIALHGAGGTDNMFFDGYGNGLITRLCQERGWLLVAPSNSLPTPELIKAIDQLYPVDRKKIYLVGHSMGAAMAVRATQNNPDLYRGVACLGGGAGVTPVEAHKTVAFFIGCGSEDFALAGAKSLQASLKKASIPGVLFREYPGIEHLTVVQLALRDVLAYFEKQ